MGAEPPREDQIPELTVVWQTDVPDAPAPRSHLGQRKVLIAAAGAVVLFAGIGVGVALTSRPGSADGTAPAATASTGTVPTLPPPPAASPTPTEDVSPSQKTRPELPDGAVKACPVVYSMESGPSYAAVNLHATCGFAEEVRRAYIRAGGRDAEEPLRDVYSPKYKKHYDMSCSGKPVRCTGGINAVVYLYG